MVSFNFNSHGKTYEQLSKDRKAAKEFQIALLEAVIKEQGKNTMAKDAYGNSLNYTRGEALQAAKSDKQIKPGVENPIDKQLSIWKGLSQLSKEVNP